MANATRPAATPGGGPAGYGSGGVARSSSARWHPGWIWGVSAAVVLAGGVTLHAARAEIGSSLDRWVPKPERRADLPQPGARAALPAPEPAVERSIEPEWTFVDVEAAVRPLPQRAEFLIAEGRAEMSEFADLDSADETRALVTRNRWRRWGPIWHNRVARVRGPLPPAAACDAHAALEPTCRAVRDSLVLLDRVTAAESAGEAKEFLDAAAAILEDLRRSQAEAEAEVNPPEPGAP